MSFQQFNSHASYRRSVRRPSSYWSKYQTEGTLNLPEDQTVYHGTIEIHDNEDLKNLGNLTELYGDLEIIGCKNLEQLSNLRKINGNVYIGDCPKLFSFGTLSEVSGFFICEQCPSLTSVGHLQKVGDVCSFINTGMSEFPKSLNVGISKTSLRKVQVFVPA
jgi:hypothetical protein